MYLCDLCTFWRMYDTASEKHGLLTTCMLVDTTPTPWWYYTTCITVDEWPRYTEKHQDIPFFEISRKLNRFPQQCVPGIPPRPSPSWNWNAWEQGYWRRCCTSRYVLDPLNVIASILEVAGAVSVCLKLERAFLIRLSPVLNCSS